MAETALAPAPATTRPDQPLDELMLAMDVVDTLRHGEALVERELSADDRRAKMIERLREIYRTQGIAVPDRILADGVAALEQERFVYKPRVGGFSFTLARAYVRRGAIGRRVGIIGGAVVAIFLVWFLAFQLPAQHRAAADRTELAETLPQQLTQLVSNIVSEAVDPAVDAAAQASGAEGQADVAAGNATAARAVVASLQATLNELRLTYDVEIVSRPNEDSGVYRIPDANESARNYYLIVEAVGADGRAIARPVTSEEDQSTRTVTKWGQRVPASTYDAAVADKQNDGIIEDNVLGSKVRGELAVDWSKPVLTGAITSW